MVPHRALSELSDMPYGTRSLVLLSRPKQDMFEQSFVPKGRGRSRWTIAAALLVQVLVVAARMVVPLLYVQDLPPLEVAATPLTLEAPPPPAPIAARPTPRPPVRVIKPMPRRFNPNVLIAPKYIPKYIAKITELPPPPESGIVGGIPGGIPGGQAGGVIGGILSSVPRPLPPPPPVEIRPTAPPKTPERIRVGGNVEAGLLVHEVAPSYPLLAKDARIGGLVRLKAVINRHGGIQDLSVISGHPMLVEAALDAVKQWAYKPTYLNGNPVEVETEIDVHFNLSS